MLSVLKQIPKSSYLLISILIFIFGSLIFEYIHIAHYANIVLYTLIFIGTYFSIEKKSVFIKSMLIIGLVFNLFLFISSVKTIQLAIFLVSAMIFTYITFVLIHQIARTKKMDSYILVEAVNGYLLIGLISVILNSLILLVDKNAINFESTPSLSDIIYYSYINLTSIGFGEIVPKSQIARKISIFTGISGQLYLAIIIALIVGKFSSLKSK